MFIQHLFSDPRAFFSMILIVTFSICCHEYVHAFTAYKLGDPTAAEHGHLTLNPLKQMGVISIILLLFIGIAWGQVPVDTRKLRGRHAPAITAAAGPLTNLVLAALFSLLFYLCTRYSGNKFAMRMLIYGAIINMILAIFNMLPLPGLDGWNILRTYWKKDLAATPEFIKGVFIVLTMLVFTFFHYIYDAAQLAVIQILNLIFRIGGGMG